MARGGFERSPKRSGKRCALRLLKNANKILPHQHAASEQTWTSGFIILPRTAQSGATLSGECVIRFYEDLQPQILELLEARPWPTIPALYTLHHTDGSDPNPAQVNPDFGGGGVIEERRDGN